MKKKKTIIGSYGYNNKNYNIPFAKFVRLFWSNLQPYLDENAKLNIRVTSKFFLEFLEAETSRPYKTEVEFLLGVTGDFFQDEKEFLGSYAYYKTMSNNVSDQPAVLYKLSDDQAKKYIVNYLGSPKVRHSKIDHRYNPGVDHGWGRNYAWMLGGFDAGLSYVILSPLNAKNTERNTDSNQISAFANEIGMAINVGYTVSVNEQNKIVLLPPAKLKQKIRPKALLLKDSNTAFTLFDSINSEANIIRAVKKIQFHLALIQKTVKEATTKTELASIKLQIEASIISTAKLVVQDLQNHKIAIAKFIDCCSEIPEFKKLDFFNKTEKNNLIKIDDKDQLFLKIKMQIIIAMRHVYSDYDGEHERTLPAETPTNKMTSPRSYMRQTL